jgi:hypothetical protein
VKQLTTRLAHAADHAVLVQLALLATRRRQSLEPKLWSLAPDAEARIAASLERSTWLVAEQDDIVWGAVPVQTVPAPPVYALDGPAGLIGDDLGVRHGAPPGTLELLLDAAEQHLRAQQVAVLVASCPATWNEGQAALEARGYAALTLWMAKTRLGNDLIPGVRPMSEADLPLVVALNAEAQARKAEAAPRFWTPHPDASARFGAWMRRSLNLPDRDLLIDEGGQGFLVAQPAGLPPGHDAAAVGLIDDFYSRELGGALGGDAPVPVAIRLLRAAERTLTQRGRTGVIAICPAAWTIRRDVLLAQGYHTANLWLLKD